MVRTQTLDARTERPTGSQRADVHQAPLSVCRGAIRTPSDAHLFCLEVRHIKERRGSVSIYVPMAKRVRRGWRVSLDHRFAAARPMFRREPHLRHVIHVSNYAYTLRRFLAERSSRIKWKSYADHRQVQHVER